MPALMCWNCTTQEGWFREAIGCGCHLLICGSTGKEGSDETCECEGCSASLTEQTWAICEFLSRSKTFLWVQDYYCCSNSFPLMKCLHYHYKKTLLRLSYLDCLLDNWPDHQSKASCSSALGNVGKAYVHQLWIAALLLHWLHQVG